MLWLALVLWFLGVLTGGFALRTATNWYRAFPHMSEKALLAAVFLVFGFFTNFIFLFSFIARRSQPVAVGWNVLMIASLVNNVAAAILIPVFALNAGYWLWLGAFAVAAWAFLFLPPDKAAAMQLVPQLLCIWCGWLLFWTAIMIVNYYAPVPAVVDDRRPSIALTSYVTDDAHLLQPGDQQSLIAMLKAFEDRTSDQIGVAIYPRCPSPSIEDFTIRVAEASRFGKKGLDNGAVLFIFIAERTARIEVGYGLEGALPDAVARQILDTQLVPHFARGEYHDGIAATLSAMTDAVSQEYGNTHKRDVLGLLWPQFKVAMAKIPRRLWPLARTAPLSARIGVSFFGTLLGLGVWDGFENAARILLDIFMGASNLIRGRRFRYGMKPFQLGSIIDTVKLAVIIACIAGGFVLVAGGGSFGGGGALTRWIEKHAVTLCVPA